MREIKELSVQKTCHGLKVEVYQNLVLAIVYMPMKEYVKYIPYGIQAEREALFNLMTSVFKDDFIGKKIFNSDEEINKYLISRDIQPYGGGGNYCKNTIFEIEEANFEKSLEKIIQYIKTQSENYEKNKNQDGFIQLKGGEYPLGKENIPITLSPFAISPTQVTYGQMSLFALHYSIDPKEYHNDRFGESDAERPAMRVGWFDAIRYANWLSGKNEIGAVYTVYGGKGVLNPKDESYWDDESWDRVDFDIAKKGYRLPTKTEWEYAASGYGVLGRKQIYPGTDEPDSLKEYAWYEKNSEGIIHKIALLKPNANGLYDMGGNVQEWCFDEYREGVIETFKNQKNPFFQSGKRPYETLRSLRGGSCVTYILNCRVLVTDSVNAYVISNSNGFRLVRTL